LRRTLLRDFLGPAPVVLGRHFDSIVERSSAPASLPTSTRSDAALVDQLGESQIKAAAGLRAGLIETQKQVLPAFEQLTATMKASCRRAS
jgi:hypothetical protein